MYSAIVCKVNTRPFPNADRLLLGTCLGNQVVVGLDTQDSELGVFFPTDGQLSEVFCKEHDLISYADPVTGEKKGGYFAKNRRVRSQKFRGEKSDGFWVSLAYFSFTGYDLSKMTEGMQFTELNSVQICNKFETQATRSAQAKGIKSRNETPMFRMHIETEQFRFFADSLPIGSLVTISEKVHGTSHRIGNVLEDLPLSKIQSVFNRLLNRHVFNARRGWKEIHGTRRVILDSDLTDTFYGEAFRGKAVQKLSGQLRKGEVVYLEIAGWVNDSTPIMASQDVTKLKDKAFEKRYGKTMIYKYGNLTGFQSIHVYRIAQVNEDGFAVELSWNQMTARCKELGVRTVPFLDQFILNDLGYLRGKVEQYASGDSTLDQGHMREGVVVRIEAPDGTTIWYKFKNFEFGVLEGYSKEDEKAIDLEEAS